MGRRVMGAGAVVAIRRSRFTLAAFGGYYGLMAVLPVMAFAGVILGLWPFLGSSVGYACIVLACAAMIYLVAKTTCCRVVVTDAGVIMIFNPFRKYMFHASNVEYMALSRVIGSEKAVCVRLFDGGRMKVIAIGLKEMGDFGQLVSRRSE